MSLKSKIILLVVSIVVTAQGTASFFLIRSLSNRLTRNAEKNASHLSWVLLKSLRLAMIRNRREDIQRSVEDVAGLQGIAEVKILNKAGAITVSDDRRKVGERVDMKAEACVGCHRPDRTLTVLPTARQGRVFRNATGSRMLGLATPISNEKACYGCHPSAQRVLGVLDTVISLDDVDRELNTAYAAVVFFSAGSGLIICIVSGLMLTRLVNRPLARLARGIERVTNGDLSPVELDGRRDEIAIITARFNAMMEELKRSRAEIHDLNAKLRDKVEEGTEKLQKAEAQLVQAGKLVAMGELAAGIAHEINNPLTGVLTYSTLLLKDASEPELKEDLQVIVDETTRCRDIVKKLLDFARRDKPQKKPANLNKVIRDTLKLLRNQALFQNIELHEDFDGNLPESRLDMNQIKQVLMNMFINAAEAMKGTGALRIETKTCREPRCIEAAITDTGPGIPKDKLDKIFEPFYTSKGSGRGTGLGLAVSLGIIKEHGGTIDVESYVGRGTTFRIRLPS
jgi:two-component system NtrC family sensor kinase